MASEDWPTYHIGSRDQMHAIGVLIVAWNMIESAYQCFIQLIFPHHMKAGIGVYELLNNDGRVKLIRSEVPGLISDMEKDLLEYFFKSAFICKDNRNAIAHSHYGNQAGDLLLLTKGRSKDQQSTNRFTFTVTGLREMADSSYATAFFGYQLFSSIQVRVSNEAWARQGVAPKVFVPLPEKPPLPRSWDQIRDIPKPPPPPPPSSQA